MNLWNKEGYDVERRHSEAEMTGVLKQLETGRTADVKRGPFVERRQCGSINIWA